MIPNLISHDLSFIQLDSHCEPNSQYLGMRGGYFAHTELSALQIVEKVEKLLWSVDSIEHSLQKGVLKRYLA